MDLVVVETPVISEFHLTVTPEKGESPAAMAARVARVLKPLDATVVRHMVYGSFQQHATTLESLRQALKDPALRVTWVEGAACDGNAITGMQIHAIAGARVHTLTQGDRSMGGVCVWRDSVATHCVLDALAPTRTGASPPEQARETFELLQAGLALAGMNMKDLVRTWFFLDDLLSWYPGFNRVRTDFFERSGLRAGSFPASTGVAGRNAAGAALTAAGWAMRPHDPAVQLAGVVASPRQCPAPSYGSSFSRALEINSAGFRQLLVSGTASISPDGRTACAGDVRGQMELTLQVVEALLKSRCMSIGDVSRATAYFTSPDDRSTFEETLAHHKGADLPVVKACCGICRGDLLFELELDALAV
jgi:enamine deaminase RidA (YjgF/YER057c/UK114 family)